MSDLHPELRQLSGRSMYFTTPGNGGDIEDVRIRDTKTPRPSRRQGAYGTPADHPPSGYHNHTAFQGNPSEYDYPMNTYTGAPQSVMSGNPGRHFAMPNYDPGSYDERSYPSPAYPPVPQDHTHSGYGVPYAPYYVQTPMHLGHSTYGPPPLPAPTEDDRKGGLSYESRSVGSSRRSRGVPKRHGRRTQPLPYVEPMPGEEDWSALSDSTRGAPTKRHVRRNGSGGYPNDSRSGGSHEQEDAMSFDLEEADDEGKGPQTTHYAKEGGEWREYPYR